MVLVNPKLFSQRDRRLNKTFIHSHPKNVTYSIRTELLKAVSLCLYSQCWGCDTCFGEYQDFENLRYPEHIQNYFVISDSCLAGRKPVHYEHRHLGRHHDHLICTKHGRIEICATIRIVEAGMVAAIS